jgi:hypothetical protein
MSANGKGFACIAERNGVASGRGEHNSEGGQQKLEEGGSESRKREGGTRTIATAAAIGKDGGFCMAEA